MKLELLLLFVIWMVYLTLHSILADSGVKERIVRKAPWIDRYYRLIYSTISTLGLLVIGWLVAVSTTGKFYEGPEFLKYLGLILGSWGVYIIKVAFRNFSLAGFFGLRKEEYPMLIRSGIHERIRHPIYSGIIVLMIGMTLAVLSWAVLISTVAIFVYLPMGIHFEEKKLIEQFGEDYVQYKREVPALIPRF